MTEQEREMLRRLKRLNDDAGDFALGVMSHELTADELMAYATELVRIALLIKEIVTAEHVVVPPELPLNPADP